MDIIKIIFKSVFWGLSLLFLTIVILIEGMNFFNRASDIRSSEYPKKIESLLKNIEPVTQNLERLMKNYDFNRSLDEQKLIAVEKARVRLLMEEQCADCQLNFFNPNEKYELNNYLESLSRKANPINNSLRNRNLFISMLGSLLCIGVAGYLAVGLIFARKNLSQFLLRFLAFLPFIFITFSLSSITTSPEYFYTQLGYENNSFNWWVLGLSIVYFFTVYPAIFAVANKLNIPTKSMYKLKS